MSEKTTLDRLYELMPAIHRQRDAEQGYPLKALFRIVAEQADVVQQDIERLYENWFIETCDDWVVPYLGDLVGYRPIVEAGSRSDGEKRQAFLRNRAIIPRREVAKTVRLRRRKGTLALLEELAWDVAGWPARAVEFRQLVSRMQAVNHVRPELGRTIDVRNVAALELIDGRRLEPESRLRLEPAEAEHERLIAHGAFDMASHNVDLRRINSRRTAGRYNLPNVGLFVFRLNSYSIDKSYAPAQSFGAHFFTFSPLGNDVPLFIKVMRESDPSHIAEEVNLPVLLRRHALIEAGSTNPKHSSADFYGEGKSLCIWTRDWDGHQDDCEPVPAAQVIPADLSNWEAYLPPRNFVAVDPVLGRIVFSPRQFPRGDVRVSYHYGFSADIGGGRYERQLSAPDDAYLYRVGENESFNTIEEAKAAWERESPRHAIIELSDNGTYNEPINFDLAEAQSLQLRAAVGVRPVIWLAKSKTWATVCGRRKSRFALDGILIAGMPLNVEGELAELKIRHATLVPGLTLTPDCKPDHPDRPSIVLLKTTAAINIEHSIVGSIQVKQDEVAAEPIAIRLTDSILDATSPQREALGSDARLLAHTVLTVVRSTVIGRVESHAIDLAENSIFLGRVKVGRSQRGCMRFCYVELSPRDQDQCSRTPKRYRCQPDLAVNVFTQQDDWANLPADTRQELQQMERLRVRPIFNSQRYGMPTYCQLANSCAAEIKRGANDQAEMGVFHNLYESQRQALLDVRLAEFTPADTDAGIIFAT